MKEDAAVSGVPNRRQVPSPAPRQSGEPLCAEGNDEEKNGIEEKEGNNKGWGGITGSQPPTNNPKLSLTLRTMRAGAAPLAQNPAAAAAAVSRKAQNSKEVATCLAEIDSILHMHREALVDRSNKPSAR